MLQSLQFLLESRSPHFPLSVDCTLKQPVLAADLCTKKLISKDPALVITVTARLAQLQVISYKEKTESDQKDTSLKTTPPWFFGCPSGLSRSSNTRLVQFNYGGKLIWLSHKTGAVNVLKELLFSHLQRTAILHTEAERGRTGYTVFTCLNKQ